MNKAHIVCSKLGYNIADVAKSQNVEVDELTLANVREYEIGRGIQMDAMIVADLLEKDEKGQQLLRSWEAANDEQRANATEQNFVRESELWFAAYDRANELYAEDK